MSEWKEEIPEALREIPYFSKAESLDDAIGKINHAAKLVGTSIRIPGSDASDDDRAAFYDKLKDVDGVIRMPLSDDTDGLKELFGKLGTPAEAADYALPEIEDFTWDDDIAKDLKSYALEAGLTKAQFATFAAKIAGQEQAAGSESALEKGRIRKELRTDWGETLEEREALIRGWMAKSDAPEQLRKQFEDRNLDISTMNWLHETAKQFKGDVSPISHDGVDPSKPLMTPGEAREKIHQYINDLMGMTDADPRYRDLQQKLVQAQGLASG